MSVFLLVLPDFLLIALGWALLHRLGFDRNFFASAEKLVYFVLFPALLFHSITRTPLELGSTTVLLTATVGVMLAGIALGWLARPIIHPDPRAHASVIQCGFRFNTYLGLSLATSLGSPEAQTIMAVIVGFAIPISNIGAVHALASQHGGKATKEILKNPFIIATVAALVCNFLHVPIPDVIQVAMGRLGACAIAIGLLCVGATLSLEGGRTHGPLIAWMSVVKLALLPLCALGIGWLLNLSLTERQTLLLFAALPASSTAHVLAARMGGDGRLVAVTMSLGTVASVLTLPLWLLITT